MKRWGRSLCNLCTLCRCAQTNKHVLSNCSAPGPLSRYSNRHNNILAIITDYLTSILPSSHSLYVDLPNRKPISTIFKTLRPDLVIYFNNKLFVFELTVCHETNFSAAKERKINKYQNLKNNLNFCFLNNDIDIATVEISTLGFVSGLNSFCDLLKFRPFPESILNKITSTAIDHSKKIYHNRNVPDDDINS